ncbi:helix-turn-helix domain-containing protein (plasmid) [Legionella sp. D16C41]|uniref:helix-turn-helix domain-containing protein n=1 Tax=Legionella sp. D16C41 TaxID=3402688 RepID=UPI003AF6FC68
MLKNRTNKSVYIGKNLDFLLKEYKIDIKNLSAATGVPAPSISRLKKEGANPTISTLEPLLDYFKIDMKSFLYEDLSDPVYQSKRKIGEVIPIPVFNTDNIGNTKSSIIKFIASSGITNTNVLG